MEDLIITHEQKCTLQVQIENHLDFIEVNTLSVQQQMGIQTADFLLLHLH